MNELENVDVVVESTEAVVENAVRSGRNWKLIGAIVAGTILTGGLVYVGIKVAKKAKAKKAAEQLEVVEEIAQN